MGNKVEELLTAQLVTQKRLDKALVRLENLQEEIKSYQLAIELIERELVDGEE